MKTNEEGELWNEAMAVLDGEPDELIGSYPDEIYYFEFKGKKYKLTNNRDMKYGGTKIEEDK